MGFFSGAYKRLKNSWGNIGKKAGTALTLIGKSEIPGMVLPSGFGSFLTTPLKKIGQSMYKTGEAILGEIDGDEYFDSLAEINKYGLVFGPYNTYKTIQEYGFEDGVKRVIQDNIDYAKDFLPMDGEPVNYANKVINTAVEFAQDPVNAVVNEVDDTYNDNKTVKTNKPTNSSSYQKAAAIAKEKAASKTPNQNKSKSNPNAVMNKINNYLNSVNK